MTTSCARLAFAAPSMTHQCPLCPRVTPSLRQKEAPLRLIAWLCETASFHMRRKTSCRACRCMSILGSWWPLWGTRGLARPHAPALRRGCSRRNPERCCVPASGCVPGMWASPFNACKIKYSSPRFLMTLCLAPCKRGVRLRTPAQLRSLPWRLRVWTRAPLVRSIRICFREGSSAGLRLPASLPCRPHSSFLTSRRWALIASVWRGCFLRCVQCSTRAGECWSSPTNLRCLPGFWGGRTRLKRVRRFASRRPWRVCPRGAQAWRPRMPCRKRLMPMMAWM